MAYYEENDLWMILLSIIAGLGVLNDHNIRYMNIKPSNILINTVSKHLY